MLIISNLDIWTVHGYLTDGVTALEIQEHRDRWERHYNEFQVPSGKTAWMTETSGFDDTWDTSNADAFDLSVAIYSMLYYGKGSAWVYWYGAGALLNGSTPTQRYYSSKQFFRYIRPGSRMVSVTTDAPDILACAFENTALNNFVVVLINVSSSSKLLSLTGDNIPAASCHLISIA
ncbi:MAG: hypothetical protein ACM3WV_01510 [Bacillota bacterium]